MAIPGIIHGAKIGPDHVYDRLGAGGATTYAMAALNTGWCARFVATENKDITAVKVNFSAVTAAGVIAVRIETVDATTGKPTGTLYDANAAVDLVPVAGWNTATFASAPTTNLTVGTQYAIVLLTTTGGTTMTLRSSPPATAVTSGYPTVVLTAADGTTRSNFAEITDATPICSLILDDSSEDPMGFCPYVAGTTNSIVTTAGKALKVTVAGTVVVAGVEAHISVAGTPAGDLRLRILDSGDSAVSNSTFTADKDSLITGLASGDLTRFMFGGLVTLAAGTYRIVFDSASSANSSNCFVITSITPVTTAVAPDNYVLSTCPDVGTPSWTDSATAEQPPIRLIVDSITASGGSQVGQPAATTLNGQLQR